MSERPRERRSFPRPSSSTIPSIHVQLSSPPLFTSSQSASSTSSPAVPHVDPALARQALDRLKARGELHVRLVQRERRVHAELAAQVHHREEQVAQLRLERACVAATPCARRRRRRAPAPRAPRPAPPRPSPPARRRPASRSRHRRRGPAGGTRGAATGRSAGSPSTMLSRFFAFIPSQLWRSPPS